MPYPFDFGGLRSAIRARERHIRFGSYGLFDNPLGRHGCLDSNNNNLGNFFSDRRLKTDIRQVATSSSGIPIYHFRYRGQMQWYQGVIAQDLLHMRPAAVVRADNGYLMVNYRLLDVEFRALTPAEVAVENRQRKGVRSTVSTAKQTLP